MYHEIDFTNIENDFRIIENDFMLYEIVFDEKW